MFKKIKSWWQDLKKKKELEYHKRLLNFIIINSIGMMWMSYILAWFGREDIAESLSNTVASSIVAVVIPYLITKTIENVSKYGSRINRTTKEFDGLENIKQARMTDELVYDEQNPEDFNE